MCEPTFLKDEKKHIPNIQVTSFSLTKKRRKFGSHGLMSPQPQSAEAGVGCPFWGCGWSPAHISQQPAIPTSLLHPFPIPGGIWVCGTYFRGTGQGVQELKKKNNNKNDKEKKTQPILLRKNVNVLDSKKQCFLVQYATVPWDTRNQLTCDRDFEVT